uniref:Serpin domain-containing protein n=1 Tax=Panagrolaimus sp. JU765 TaxID=591449 RepID=A0AC34R7Y5_9BILA
MVEDYDEAKGANIRLPEFEIRSTPDIEGFLKDAGLGELFDDENPAFTDNDGGNLTVSKIIQKLEIKLTKNGIGKDGSEEEPTPEEGEIITIDQPF